MICKDMFTQTLAYILLAILYYFVPFQLCGILQESTVEAEKLAD